MINLSNLFGVIMKKLKLYKILGVCLIAFGVMGRVDAGTLYTVQASTDTLYSIDTDTLSVTSIGSLGANFSFGGLAYDSNSSTLYMIGGRSNNNLYTVNQSTGLATLVGNYGINDLFGLAFDTTNNVLYGTQFSGGSGLYSLNTSNGSATTINSAMNSQIGGLAYDSSRDNLVGMEDGPGRLYSIDRSNGVQSLLVDGDFVSDSGLAYDRDKDLFWDFDYYGNLFSYDPNNAYGRTTHLDLSTLTYDGLAYVSSVPVPAAVWLFGSGLIGLLGVARRKQSV